MLLNRSLLGTVDLRRRVPRVAAVLLVAALGSGRPAAAAEPPLNAAVRARIDAAGLDGAAVSVSAVEVNSGRILCGIDERRLMTPASNTKLITTGVALLTLGEDHQFTTAVYADGEVRDHVLHGDLVVVADGDPAISGREHDRDTTAVFDAWARTIARSIRAVEGNLVIDATAFDGQLFHPSWPEGQSLRWYCAPISAFALNDNCVDVSVKPGLSVGQPARVLLAPPTAYFEIRNRCRTVASGKDRVVISRLPDRDTLVIRGTLPPKGRGASYPVAVVDPLRYAATVLGERLAAAGVHLGGDIVIAERPVDAQRMRRLAATSHSLVSAIRTANKRSQNFYAEMILKTLGRSGSAPASFRSGVEAVAAQLEKMGIERGTYAMDDGSGMSRRNAFEALQFTVFLRFMARSDRAGTFLSSLAVSGTDGTLRARLVKRDVRGKILAKTGHVRGVSTLSGYARSGEELVAFSILVQGEKLNRSRADRLQDAICRLLVEPVP